VSGVAEWHINADEPSEIDYNTNFKTAGQLVSMYAPDQFRMSDHDPLVVGLDATNAQPTADAGGPYSVDEGSAVTVSATGNDPDGGAVTYGWDLDDNGSFETPGQSVSFDATALDGPSSHTIKVRVTDNSGLTAVSSATVNVVNVRPSATFNAPSSVFAGFSFTLSLTGPSDPSQADTAAGFKYQFDCGGGYGALGTSSTASCPTSATGTLNVRGKIVDKDGGSHEYSAQVTVTVTYASLCTLTRQLVTKADVAQGLCDKLSTAAAADASGDTKKRDAALAAYRNQLDAQTGKSVTAANATLLKSLSKSL
jgi:hypothetical protein